VRTSSKWRLPLLATAALAAGAALGGGTLALWNGTTGGSAATIVAGDLAIASSDLAWEETSPDVASPQTGTFLVRQGDTAAASFPFHTVLDGDNLAANIGVAWNTAPSLPAGVTGTYVVLDPDENTVASGVLGADDAALARVTTGGDYVLRVTLDFAGLSDRFGAGSAVQTADLGSFDVTLTQIRSGEGFE
jgi:alternate signal-mediated exported protein